MCVVEKGKVKDWMDAKRSIRECAVMEGVATKSNKPMLLRSFLKDGDWSLASMSCQLVPSTSINISSDLCLTEKYKKV
eukprot:710087-Ditylum_brightwellii.AAC.1